MHRFSCLKSEFSCIGRIPTSNDNILVGNSQLCLLLHMHLRITSNNTELVLGEVLVFYLPIRFFYYLANLIIFTRSSRIPCIFFLEGGFKGIYLREKKFTLSYVVSEI